MDQIGSQLCLIVGFGISDVELIFLLSENLFIMSSLFENKFNFSYCVCMCVGFPLSLQEETRIIT